VIPGRDRVWDSKSFQCPGDIHRVHLVGNRQDPSTRNHWPTFMLVKS
jgi:hypothetical protein